MRKKLKKKRVRLQKEKTKDEMIISNSDFEVLMQCINALENRHTTRFKEIQFLKKKILLAKRVMIQKVPSEIVTMNSFVELQKINTGLKLKIQLVYPDFENIREHRISIFSALGVAIYLRKIGDEVIYSTWRNENRIRIADVIFQTAAIGN